MIAFFIGPDAVAPAPGDAAGSGSVARGTLSGVLLLGLVVLVFPSVVLADNCGDLSDCWTNWMKASLAVAGGAMLAAQRFVNRNLPLPPSYPLGGPFGPERPEERKVPAPEMPPWYEDYLREHDQPTPPPDGVPKNEANSSMQAPPYDPGGSPGGGGPNSF